MSANSDKLSDSSVSKKSGDCNQLQTHLLDALVKTIESEGLPFMRGIEKEGLRATDNEISQSDHPRGLGHPLTHPTITTDYSEALTELITPVKKTREELLQSLTEIHQQVASNIGDETLWPGSMPCLMNGEKSIRIAEYGDSNIGKLKHVYRQGLGVRYGRIMQSIAGLHFNFSFSDGFWLNLQETMKADHLSLQDFKSQQYFALIRNFRRYSWLLMYLFGASPCLDKSFINGKPHNLDPFDDKGSYYKPYATSLRMGDLGYHNNAQSSLAICFNSLSNFITTLDKAIHTPYPEYEKIGLKKNNEYIQINSNILQIENEYYSAIRPKRTMQKTETPRHALSERGVEYVEVRCLDLNPFLPLGISSKQVDFLDTFLSYCLLSDSPLISDEDCILLDKNFEKVVNKGREPNLKLNGPCGDVLLEQWALEIVNEMSKVSSILDKSSPDQRYSLALDEQKAKILHSELCPSAQVLTIMRDESLSWIDFAGELGFKHKTCLLNDFPNKETVLNELSSQAKKSFENEELIKSSDTSTFEDFLKSYQTK
ncbi:MAG: glutamate--cysteine ligase [Oleiphilaceae bacterium]|jgi:glutamate--cysteine ligase